MKKSLLAAVLLAGLSFSAAAQRAQGSMGAGVLGLVAANEYSKEESLYRAKEYVMATVLGPTTDPLRFEAFALAAATSGELTTVAYRCPERKKEGLLLAFYGNNVTPAGVRYQGYAFKDLPKEKATALLAKLDAVLNDHTAYLRTETDNNNVFFSYDDLTFVVYVRDVEPRLRVFWGEFDAEWNISALRKTERRLVKKI